jgi:hypothetical protein
VAVPLLVVLYFLKLRRREMDISSTFLWKRAVQDLQVNAPFQRLRRNLLLLLQLLALSAILLGLAGPVLRLEVRAGQRVVILIDHSASMTATDAQPDRLSLAKEQAMRVVQSLRTGGAFSFTGQADQAMVIAFDSHAKVMCGFTDDKDHLRAAIEAIGPGDGGSLLAEAVEVGRAYAQPPEEAKNQSSEPAAQLELFSDGRLTDFADVVVRPGELRYHCVASSDDNVGFVAMDARRSYENPREVTVFAVLSNCGHEPVACDVQLTVNHNIRAAQRVAVPAAIAPADGQPGRPSQVSVTFPPLEQEGEAIIEVRQLRPDALAMDDAAWAILPPPRRLAVALVTAGNYPLKAALEACPLASLKLMSPAEFDKTSAEQVEAFDVVVLDNHAREDLPRGRYLSFGEVPLGIPSQLIKEGDFVVDWQARHPVLEYINLGNVYASEHRRMELPRQAHALAEFSDGPAIALVRAKGSTLVAVGFELGSSNWPFEPGFVMFCMNATAYLGADVGASTHRSLHLGDPLVVEGAVGTNEAEVSDPAGGHSTLTADASGGFRLPQTTRVGVYSIKAGERPWERFAVNLLSTDESNIAPVTQLNLSGAAVTAEAAAPRRQNQEVWPWLAGLALALVCLEWAVYNSKVRI